jgi:hypothetical protein
MENWIDDFSHESLSTPESQQDFRKAMGKYATEADAIVGGFNASKEAGKNFKLPKSIDSLPSEDMRTEFRTQTMGLLGIEPGIKTESLDKINWVKGLPTGSEAHQPTVDAFSKFVVDNGVSESLAQKIVELGNTLGMTAQQKALDLAAENVKTAKETLTGYFGQTGLAEHLELLKRVFQNNAKLTAEEFEAIADDLASDDMMKRAVFMKGLLNIIAPLGKEGQTETPQGGGPKPPKTIKEELPKTAAALGWNE